MVKKGSGYLEVKVDWVIPILKHPPTRHLNILNLDCRGKNVLEKRSIERNSWSDRDGRARRALRSNDSGRQINYARWLCHTGSVGTGAYGGNLRP